MGLGIVLVCNLPHGLTLEDARAIAEAAWTDYVQMKKDRVRSILNLGCRRGVTQIG